MHFQLTHVIIIYETIKNSYDGGKRLCQGKKNQNSKNLAFGRITLPSTEQSEFNWAEHHWLHYYEKTNGPN